MKHFYTIPFRFLSVIALALSLQSFHTFAADNPKTIPPKEVSDAAVQAAWQRRLPEYNSDNLPLGEVVMYLQQQFPEINFHLKAQHSSSGADPIDLQATSVRINRLRVVTLTEFLQVLELATERAIQITGKPGDRLVVFDSKIVEPPSRPVPIETRVFSLVKYLENRPPEDEARALALLDDVLAESGKMYAQASLNGHFNPRLNVHRGTKLLIVVGRPDELQLVEQIVTGLQGPATPRNVSSTVESEPKPTISGQPARR